MKVYVIVKEYGANYNTQASTEVFYTEENALARMKELYDEEMNHSAVVKNTDPELLMAGFAGEVWAIYENGNYIATRIEAHIEVVEVQ